MEYLRDNKVFFCFVFFLNFCSVQKALELWSTLILSWIICMFNCIGGRTDGYVSINISLSFLVSSFCFENTHNSVIQRLVFCDTENPDYAQFYTHPLTPTEKRDDWERLINKWRKKKWRKRKGRFTMTEVDNLHRTTAVGCILFSVDHVLLTLPPLAPTP